MARWKNCRTESFYRDDESSCEVRINGSEIVVSYRDDSRWITYRGNEVAPGHFELSSDHGGKATLHRSPDSDWLEGFWIESPEEGMWRIELGEESD